MGQLCVANPNMVGPDMVSIHCNTFTEQAWEIARDKGVHISCAVPIEMQMGHGTPAIQPSLDHGILPTSELRRRHQYDARQCLR